MFIAMSIAPCLFQTQAGQKDGPVSRRQTVVPTWTVPVSMATKPASVKVDTCLGGTVPAVRGLFSFLLSPAPVSAVDAHRPVKSTRTI